ncbi:MAG: hypothetical protein M9921_06905 [Fimbriimonadaceae bacterium]|nr:hypothetical protein [Chthonomonadaceae bacterium]MCO5296567.1 hypothetical protein [Fimbriimonadaceae bacterium]
MKFRFACGLAATALLLGATTAQATETWRVTGGTTTLELAPGILEAIGLDVVQARTTAKAKWDMPDGLGFALGESTLLFEIENHQFRQFESGRLTNTGGFGLRSGRRTFALNGFEIQPKAALPQMGLALEGGKGSISLDINHAKVGWNPEKNQLLIGYADLVINAASAKAMGRPELAGQLIGQATIEADAKWSGGDSPKPFRGGPPRGGEEDVPLDVSIVELYGLTSYGHQGSYPNGMNGLSMATTSCNPGNANIPWYQAMDTRHPVIAMQMYRIYQGRFEQIGQSWLKHGFYALNSNQCGTCQNPGTGSLLGVNCSDTYSAGNNASQTWLGGRDEVNPFTGIWDCNNSWFSNYQPDCTRRNSGSGLSSIDHRLQVRDADLGVAGAQYFYEAYYISRDETIDKYNNIASRSINSMNWTGSQWSFVTSSEPLRPGPAITRWGDMNAIATPRDEGDAILAVKTTDLGGGNYRYDYALYVHDIDRQIREFSIPVLDSTAVTNVGFRDIDQDSGNDWTSTKANDKITWSTGTFGQAGANPLKYGTVFNFWFECATPPASTVGEIGLFKSGSLPGLTVDTKGPQTTAPPSALRMVNGRLFSGTVASVVSSDDHYAVLELNPAQETIYDQILIEMEGTSPLQSPGHFELQLEAGIQIGGTNQKVYLYDFVDNRWVLKDTRFGTLGDTTMNVVVTGAEAARYVEPGTGKIKARVGFNLVAADLNIVWRTRIDRLAWLIKP